MGCGLCGSSSKITVRSTQQNVNVVVPKQHVDIRPQSTQKIVIRPSIVKLCPQCNAPLSRLMTSKNKDVRYHCVVCHKSYNL